MTKRTVYFHEDDYCQIEVLPAQSWEYCAIQLGQIAEFSEQHRTPNGMGWTGIHVRGKAPATLAALSLDVDSVSRALSQYLVPFDRVETGYSSHREECRNTRAFGFGGTCVVFLSYDRSRAVDHIWLDRGTPEASARPAYLAALEGLGMLEDLLLVDWGRERLFLLSDAAGVSSYVLECEGFVKKTVEQMERRRLLQAPNGKVPWWKFWGSRCGRP